jgi:deoxyribose-phosphate aldolase
MSAESEIRRLAGLIDHTKLVFSPGEDESAAITTLCREAREEGFYAVCVRPRHVRIAKDALRGSEVRVAAVIGFPAEKMPLARERECPTIGNFPTAHKLAEVRQVLAGGADELDVVLPIARLKAEAATHSASAVQAKADSKFSGGTWATGEMSSVRAELAALRAASAGVPLKAILETDLLTPEELAMAVAWCVETGVDMLKTSTGMLEGAQGATPEVIRALADLLRRLDAPLGIKASGGVRTREQAMALLEAGATRIGASGSRALLL